MTKAIYMAIKLDQDIMVTNMCVKLGEDWTHTFQELDRKTYFWQIKGLHKLIKILFLTPKKCF